MQLHDSGLEPEVVLSVRDGIPSGGAGRTLSAGDRPETGPLIFRTSCVRSAECSGARPSRSRS